MVCGWLRVSLRMAGVGSLKEKRHLLRSVLDRLGRERMVAAAEVGDHDLWGNAEIGVGAVGGDAIQVERLLQWAEELITSEPRWEVLSVERSIEAFEPMEPES